MVDPVLIGLVVGLIQKAAEIGMERFFGASAAPAAAGIVAPKAVVRRHDYSDGYGALSDVNVSVSHHLTGTRRAPTFLIIEKFNRAGDGFVVPMLQGETAYLTLARDHYSIVALIVDLPRRRGGKPTLRGLGATSEFVAANNATALHVATRHPTEQMVRKVGLLASDGTLPFLLPPPPAPKALPAAPGFPLALPSTAGNQLFFPPTGGRFRCNMCTAKFSTSSALATHKRSAHPSGWQRVVDWFDDL